MLAMTLGVSMKNLFATAALALVFAACAPSAQTSNADLSFAPASPLGASVTGTGSVFNAGNGTTVYRLQLEGLPANAALGVGVYVGSCTNQGQLQYALPDLQTDAAGKATLETRIATGTLPAKAYINVHQRGAAQGFGGALACANVR
jgi:opacity protein-like surface antigen